MSTSGCKETSDGLLVRLGLRPVPSAAEELNTYAGVAPEVAADQPARESFDELYPLFLRRNLSEREKNLLWSRYRGRWVRWTGTLVSFTTNGATFRMLPITPSFDVSVHFEMTARGRLHGYRPGDPVTFVGRLDNYDDLWKTLYLNHGDLGPAPERRDAAPDGGPERRDLGGPGRDAAFSPLTPG